MNVQLMPFYCITCITDFSFPFDISLFSPFYALQVEYDDDDIDEELEKVANEIARDENEDDDGKILNGEEEEVERWVTIFIIIAIAYTFNGDELIFLCSLTLDTRVEITRGSSHLTLISRLPEHIAPSVQ